MAVRAFLSFVQENLNLVNLFREQAKNEQFDLEYATRTVEIGNPMVARVAREPAEVWQVS